MLPNQTRNIHDVSTEQFETIKMGFDQSAIVHLMGVLTNLYSDSEQACIREYPSNAQDSHIAAGNSDPIEVYLPSTLNPNFRVVDHGVGLSTDDIHNIYSKYGRSTKRDNNNETGMLGLGCKSALAYTKKFSVTGIKDGIKTISTISRGEDGAGLITILDTVTTDEPNGVTVSIPVKDESTFNRKAKDFFSYWKPGTVLVNGQEPSELDGMWLDDNTLVRRVYGDDIVVMGGVPYPVRQRQPSRRLPYGFKIVSWVGMGDVEFTPSREDLEYTDKTTKTLDDIFRSIEEKIKRKSQKEVDNATTAPEAAKAYIKWWRQGFVNDRFAWSGGEIPRNFPVGSDDDESSVFIHRINGGHGSSRETYNIDLDVIVHSLQVTGFTNKTLGTGAKRKVAQYVSDNDLDVEAALFVPERVGAPWSDDAPTVDYKDILAIKLPNTNIGGTRATIPTDEFRTFENKSFSRLSAFPKDKELILTTTAFEVSPSYISGSFPDAIIVIASKNRWNKFKREHKNAVTIQEKVEQELSDLASKLTLQDAIDHSFHYNIHKLQPLHSLRDASHGIDDPELKGLVEQISKKSGVNDRIRELRIIARYVEASQKVKHSFDIDHALSLVGKYPLVKYANKDNTRDIINYINAMYEKENK